MNRRVNSACAPCPVGLSAKDIALARLPLRDEALQLDCKLSCLSTLMMCTCFCQGGNTRIGAMRGHIFGTHFLREEKYRSLANAPEALCFLCWTGVGRIELAVRVYFSAVPAEALLIWY